MRPRDPFAESRPPVNLSGGLVEALHELREIEGLSASDRAEVGSLGRLLRPAADLHELAPQQAVRLNQGDRVAAPAIGSSERG